MQTSVTVTWDKGGTKVVNDTVVHFRAMNQSSDWTPISAVRGSTSHTVTTLKPGTEYQFFVAIHNYDKTARSQTVTVTTSVLLWFFVKVKLDEMQSLK